LEGILDPHEIQHLHPAPSKKSKQSFPKPEKYQVKKNNQEFFFKKFSNCDLARALWSVEAIHDGTLIPARRGTAVR
jgi:hypothetical protein